MIKGFNHVGVAVKDLDKAMAFFHEVYGMRLIRRDKYEDQPFETALVGIGEMRLELIASLDSESFIADFIKDRGEGVHHMSLEVDQFEQIIKNFRDKGLKVLGETDHDNFKAAFIHPQGNLGILTEIVEPKRGWTT
ncbi:MAG: VOC family protein [Deltaproteobacteria bacterium]|nr:VOC family protein [Deltaproteobacteria bacterium]